MAQNSVKALELFSISSTILGVNFQAINEDGAEGACFFIRIINASDKTVTVSYDGITSHDIIPANGILEVSTQTNAQPSNLTALFPKGMIVYVKGTAGTGTIYLCGYYQVRS